MRALLIGLVFLVMLILDALHAGMPSNVGARSALVFGFLLVSGFIVGEIICKWGVPRITGYMLSGLVCGPYLLNLVDREIINHLDLIDELALVMIALTAGGELKLHRMRRRFRGILSISVFQTLSVFAASMALLWSAATTLGFCPRLTSAELIWLVALLAVIATATSPSTAVAVILEARSEGAITDTVLGTTVLKDIFVLMGFSLIVSLALPNFGLQSEESIPSVGWVVVDMLMSLAAGGLFGWMFLYFLQKVPKARVLSIVAGSFLIISLSTTLHLDRLLVAMVAGFVMSNFAHQDVGFMRRLEQASTPIFLVFFCLAGASLRLDVFVSVWKMALIYVAVRLLFTWLGTWAAAKLTREPPEVRRFAWTGFIGQAGVSLGLASIAGKAFPDFGECIVDLVVGAIVLNQLIGPILFRKVLVYTGEGK